MSRRTPVHPCRVPLLALRYSAKGMKDQILTFGPGNFDSG
jgi:hypothetical protein